MTGPIALAPEEVRLAWVALGSMVGAPLADTLTKKQWNAAREMFFRLNAAMNDGDDRVWVVRVDGVYAMGIGRGSRSTAKKMSTAMALAVADAMRRDGHREVALEAVNGAPAAMTRPLPPWWEYVEIDPPPSEVLARAAAVEAEIDSRQPANDGAA